MTARYPLWVAFPTVQNSTASTAAIGCGAASHAAEIPNSEGRQTAKADLRIDILTYDVFKRQVAIKRRQRHGRDVFDNRIKALFVVHLVLPPFPAATVAVQEQP